MSTGKIKQLKDEAEFNALLRDFIKKVGLDVRHIRETDTPGFPDLFIWEKYRTICLLELKYDTMDLDVTQKHFHLNHPEAQMMSYFPKTGNIILSQWAGRVKLNTPLEALSRFSKEDWIKTLMPPLLSVLK